MRETEFLNALYICLGINIRVYDSELNIVKVYPSTNFLYTEYDENNLVQLISTESNYNMVVISNSAMFVLVNCEDNTYLFGPFLAEVGIDNILDRMLKENHILFQKKNINSNHNMQLYTLLDNIKLKTLIRDIKSLISLNLNNKYLSQYIEKLQTTVMNLNLDKLLFVEKDFESHEYLYETEVLDLVEKGYTDRVKEIIIKINEKILANRNQHTYRSEKNFSIILFEKLSQIAIEKGMETRRAIKARNQLIVDNEGADRFADILRIRNGAILFFTQKVHELVQKELSPFLLAIIAYINDNIYNNIQISQITKKFNISHATLSLTFKNELGTTIKKYISKIKLEDSKKLLERGFSIIEISQILGFVDSSHFSKNFKNTYHMTPTEYKRNSKNKNFHL